MLFALGCSDYDINEKADPAPFDSGTGLSLFPDIELSPERLDLGVVCTEGGGEVEVTNVGDAELLVGEVSVSGGWTLTEELPPTTLQPGESLTLSLVGSGAGTLTVRSDDPDESTVEVPLSSTPNSAPEISWIAPGSGETLPVSGTTEFSASLSDDLDAPSALAVAWSSDVDGPLSTDPAGGDGIARLSWDAAVRSAGVHTVGLSVTDSCGASTEVSIGVCQDAGYLAEDLDLDTWHFEGDASWDSTNGWVQLTQPLTDQSGTAFQTGSTVDADNVVIDFLFYVSGGSGADGISLTALDTTRMTGFVGSSGGGIGYMGLPGWSLEVDTWYNAEYSDPTELDHLSFHIDGDTSNPRAWAVLPEMEDGAWHELEATVAGSWVTVSVDGVVYIDQEIADVTAFPAYVGFTGGTGSYTNYHLIDSLEVTRYVCEE